ncbi:GNAT family N-acetyltransferase [Glycomyces sp. TRM65418]|uniref:GNAT family N-acetyltransferase n=1 Tax=Glycomyces sp. TRM65418 TaxID=2867006 RepID=UPI001CE6FB01|nr:GNAT family N-acetyltransferase [Glycomyces sp. TRM65418]MCC3761804.1 GNAT family N-acetyltransferase [Glycomyces sp. TRM65418]QZD55888.1 GNAT family N-acetyltransferase [Glycomyces sp. TRM65418]
MTVDAYRTVAAMLAVEFNDLPTARWLVDDPDERLRAVRGQFELIVEHALGHGGVVTSGDLDGAVVWFDHTVPPPPVPDYDERLRAACGAHTDRFHRLDRVMEEHHPGDPHHYVALVGVRKERRGNGIASAMLRRHHRVLDRDGIPAYLEAVSPETAKLYETLGYRAHGEPYGLEPGGPFLYPMWREPQTG